jgi:hypothetical protein
MIESDGERLTRLMRTAIRPVGEPTARRDLWPDVVRRINDRRGLSYTDRALLAAALAFSLLFPRSVLLFLYSL